MTLNKVLQEQIDSFFADYNTPQTPGCALGMILDGKLVYARGYGMADLEQQVPNTTDTVFHLASVSKQFTAACIALLEEAGELRLEDEVKRYIPYLPDYSQTLTLKHLVYMTNGLEDFYEVANLILGIPEDEYFSRENAIEIIQAAPWLKFKAGESWSYGNTGYFLLGQIVEQVSGLSLPQFAKEHIFSPLGMAHTFFRDDRRMIIPRRANGYTRAAFVHYKERQRVEQNDYYHQREPMTLCGAGQAWSTVNDLFLWDQNFYHNILGKGSPRLIERLTTPGVLNDGTPTQYAFGLLVTEVNGRKVISHEGGAPGANTVIYRMPEKRCSFICLANSNDFLNTLFRKHGKHFYEDLAGLICPWDSAQDAQAGSEKNAPSGASLPTSSASSSEREAIAGKYEDRESAAIWEVTATATGAEVRENFAQKFAIVRLPEESSKAPVYTAENNTWRCKFLREQNSETGPFTRIVVEGAVTETGSTTERVFERFFAAPLPKETLQSYAGVYVCQRLRAGYRVIPVEEGIRLQNLDPRNDLLNVVFAPTIQDLFIARYPPALNWYMLHFQRAASGQVTAFVFRDEMPDRERWVFEKTE